MIPLPHPAGPAPRWLISAPFWGLSLLLVPWAWSLPDRVAGGFFLADSPLNDQEISQLLLSEAVWSGQEALPGTWVEEATIAGAQLEHLMAQPKVFGQKALFVQALERDEQLSRLTITYADAGTHFGYLTRRSGESTQDLRQRVLQEQKIFAESYAESLSQLQEHLKELAGRPGRQERLGRSSLLDAEPRDFRLGELTVRLLNGQDRLLRVQIERQDALSRSWLEPDRAALSASSLATFYREQTHQDALGDLVIQGVPVIPQGSKPYCGLNTLAMVARYFGLNLDEDYLAVAGGFLNTGSSAGSNMPRLYQAVAREAGLRCQRQLGFDAARAQDSLSRGLPVIVWRYFSEERNRFHSRHARAHQEDPSLRMAPPDSAERETYPTKAGGAPLHASVLIGFQAATREYIFLESWSSSSEPRRMREEELSATNYVTFYFSS
ncbi:MAG: C39 family peptidase [Verrucomicrobiota bacterium]